MEDFVSIISNLGFPIAITFYLLTRFEKKLERVDESVEKLSRAVEDLTLQLKSSSDRYHKDNKKI